MNVMGFFNVWDWLALFAAFLIFVEVRSLYFFAVELVASACGRRDRRRS